MSQLPSNHSEKSAIVHRRTSEEPFSISINHRDDLDPDVEAKTAPNATQKKNGEPEYPPLRAVTLVMVALYVAMFLVALVRQCPSNSCPITDSS